MMTGVSDEKGRIQMVFKDNDNDSDNDDDSDDALCHQTSMQWFSQAHG